MNDLCRCTGREIRHGDRYSGNLLLHVSCHLAVCLPLQASLISILYHLSDLLNERLPLVLQDKLTLDHDLCDLLRVVSIQVKPKGHHLPVVGLKLTLCYSVSPVGDIENMEFRLGGLLMA